ncbi:phosphoglucosamine mutase [Thermococcus sp. P6]|uniref:phosphoglucosamine mutase n=1 Tax=Thermococcus sp. P6 TaxID=122420 RepID=UPI000B5A1FED|nr:phosphoglucosamine mutase [Thermococcus sp. P6]ASJ10262.1 phosphoglucosamine mutase [Thermococcus sp. P6]
MRLFGTAGIRGRLWEKVTPEMALRLGMAIGTYRSGRAVVGRDGRTSSIMLRNALIAGLLASGMEVLDAGLIPTPALAWATREHGDAGVMVTASHNPPTDNGIKVFNGDGTEFYVEQEGELEELYFSGNFRKAEWNEIKSLKPLDVVEDYIGTVLEFVDHETKLKVLYDGANGAGSVLAPYLLREMGARVISVNAHPDGHFPGRKPEPRYENIAYLGRLARELGVDLVIAQDGDADRIAVFDERGNYVLEDSLIALFAKRYVEEAGGGTVVVSIDTGSRIDEVVEKAGGRVVRIPLGQPHDGIRNHGAIFAAEPWKLVHPAFGPWIDSFVTMGLLIKMIDERGPLSRIIEEEIPRYYLTKKNVECPDELKEKVVERAGKELAEKLEGEIREVLTISGYRFNLTDRSWVLVRPSGTEPKVRVVVEAPDERRRDELFSMSYGTVRKALEEVKKG